jgi:hypothetical protein
MLRSMQASAISADVSSTNTPTGVAPPAVAAAEISRARFLGTDRREPGQIIIPINKSTELGSASRAQRTIILASSGVTTPQTLMSGIAICGPGTACATPAANATGGRQRHDEASPWPF